MALTIRMRIDDHDEHSYYYATGDGTEIELIPLSVTANGVYEPDEGKAYNKVTVNVPATVLETLIVDTNDTYNAPDGTAYNVVQVNVQPILEEVSRSYTENGTYTIQPSEGNDGMSEVTVVVDVPQEEPNLETLNQYIDDNGTYTYSPSTGYDGFDEVTIEVDVPQGGANLDHLIESITQNGTFYYTPVSPYDGFEDASITVNVPTGGSGGDLVHGTIDVVDVNEHSISITVPSGKSVAGFAVVPRNKTGTTDTAYSYIMNGGGKNQSLGFCGVKEVGSNYWFKFLGYKGSAASTTAITANMYHQIMNSSASTSILNSTVVWDESTDALKYVGRAYNDSGTGYGLATGCTYDYYVWFI